MTSKEVNIINDLGIHARPASLFVTTATKFNSDISVIYNDKKVDAKSILNVLALSIGKGDTIEIIGNGEDEVEAVEALVELIESGFNEI